MRLSQDILGTGERGIISGLKVTRGTKAIQQQQQQQFIFRCFPPPPPRPKMPFTYVVNVYSHMSLSKGHLGSRGGKYLKIN